MTTLIRFLVGRGLLVNLVSIFLVLLGLFAILVINREAFPNINLDRIDINIIYPGATPEEVERLVVTPVEQELKSLNGIDTMTSVSFPGSGRINLELDPKASNRDRIVTEAQLAVDRADLPDDLPDDPGVLEIDGTVFPIIQLAVSAPLSPVELKRLGDRIEDDLLNIEGVARVVTQGERKAEIRVTVDPERMREQRLAVGDIARALERWNVNAPGGDIDTPQGQKIVRVAGEFESAADAANVVLRANEQGGGLRLGEVAQVSETLEKPNLYTDVGGTPALAMIILKKSDADIIETVDRVNTYLDRLPQMYGASVDWSTFQDFSRFARLRLGVLTNNAMVGVVLVFIVLILFLRPAVALTTTWGLPIVFLGGIYVLFLSGVTLNLISMFGFIMVLGMLVDDAIIIGENITYHMERGLDPKPAAVKGATELIGPVTTTVMTTIVAFLPLMFMSGIIGKFIVAIPTVVITLLIFSWLESFLILPNHVSDVARPQAHPPERAWLRALENGYGWLLVAVVKHRYLTMLAAVLIFAGAITLAVTKMSFQLFPPVGVDEYIVRVTAPVGTSLEDMRAQLAEVDKVVREHVEPEVLEATLITSGELAVDAGDPLTQRGSRYGQVRALYQPAVTRPDHEAMDDMRLVEATLRERFPGLEIAASEIAPGPPKGRALEAEISSSQSADSRAAARRLVAFLEGIDGITSIESGLQAGDPELHVVLDRQLATYAGVDLATAAQHVRAAAGGLRVATTRRGTEEIDITIRYPDNGLQQSMLQSLLIPNARGGLIPLAQIGGLEERPGYSTIRHKEGIRIVTVVANVDVSRLTSIELNRQVRKGEPEWLGDLADRVTVRYGGEEEKNVESFRDLGKSFGFALLGIFFLLAIQFNRLSYPLIVMMAIPFGAIGIIGSFYIHDLLWKPMPLSFFAAMGMIALSGVVVNSSLVILVFIQRAIQAGQPYKEAIVSAGRRRLRAVILTASTTVVGLLPTAYGWGGLDPFVSPMALALSWGLVFSTLITLIAIPAAFAIGMDIKLLFRRQPRNA